jgi:hypothetical protein
MNDVIGGAIAGGVVGGLVGVVILVWALLQKPKACPECGTPMPKVRRPANRRQMLWGGWTCPECGCEIDRRGRRVET